VRRADPSSRRVLPTVVRRCVWSRNLVNVEAMVHWGLLGQKKGGGGGYKNAQSSASSAAGKLGLGD